MRKSLLTSLLGIAALSVSAQTIVSDSVMLGAGYANQVWYSLDNDEQGNAPKDNWDLAFDVRNIMSSIHINSVAGTTLWSYPKSNISGWANVDTSGLSTWTSRWNSDTSWSLGAMGNYADPNDGTDLDWGKYDMSTHIVTGDSLYIIKLGNGDYKKLAIETLASGTFTFKYADLDGSNAQSATIVKSNFPGKNFAYYSLQNNAALPASREPDADAWDLLFTQYTTFIPMAYTVTGVLHNRDVHTARAGNLSDKNTYTNWTMHNLESAINTIGYNWKSYTGSGYSVKDSLAFFVKAVNGDIWKMIFTGFASANGKFVFSKQKLATTGIHDTEGKTLGSLALYPNPSTGQQVTIVYDLATSVRKAYLTISDISGRTVFSDILENRAGLHQYHIPSVLKPGTYIISMSTDHGRLHQKLIVQ